MSYRNTSTQRDSSKDRSIQGNLTKTKLSETTYSTGSAKTPTIPVRRDSVKNNNPPPLPPKVKLRQEDLMTQSKIVQAKNGLQLLKKKMSQKGMISTKTSTKNEEFVEEYEPENVGYGRTPPKAKLLASQKEISSKAEVEPKKRTSGIVKSTPYQSQAFQQPNPLDDRPINNKNTDFERMIEEELRKQQIHQSVSNKVSAIKQTNAYQQPSEYAAEERLYECRMGCERTFKKETLEKHEKICKKVFMEKRKAFDSSGQRQVEGEPEVISKKPASKVNTSKIPPKIQPKQAPKGAMPKWKLQSLQFRSGLKRANNKQLTKEQAQVQSLQKDALTQCTYCGRRFNTHAAERHIPFCQQQAKKITSKPNPLLNTKKKW